MNSIVVSSNELLTNKKVTYSLAGQHVGRSTFGIASLANFAQRDPGSASVTNRTKSGSSKPDATNDIGIPIKKQVFLALRHPKITGMAVLLPRIMDLSLIRRVKH